MEIIGEKLNRLPHPDLFKASVIITMVFCHAITILGPFHTGFEKEFTYYFGDIILGGYLIATHGFMFAMGIGMIYSRKQTPADLMKRGI